MASLPPPPPPPSSGRGRAGTVSGPHAISLKVLRLSRPTLATQTPLPPTSFRNRLDIAANASLASPSTNATSSFPLTPLLTLPSAFGAAYVGETFACTLCANNEQTPAERAHTRVSGVSIVAELQTPSQQEGVALALERADGSSSSKASSTHGDGDGNEDEDEDNETSATDDEEEETNTRALAPGATLQRTLRHELKDEGPHVLAVTVTYTETSLAAGSGAAQAGRARTFRKLYQFVAQQLVAVRSKVTERKQRAREGRREWVLEAQLENVGETSVVVERVALVEREGIASRPVGVERDDGGGGKDGAVAVVLKPQDVEQVMFVVAEVEKTHDVTARIPLAQMHIEWRSAMGEKGSLTTGWLASRGR